MLQAMNTGHDGSLTTIHANTPRDAVSIGHDGRDGEPEHPDRAVRNQIASAVNVIVQVSRMADGTRKVTSIAEITGMEQDVITMQEIFRFERTGLTREGKVTGGSAPPASGRNARSGSRPWACVYRRTCSSTFIWWPERIDMVFAFATFGLVLGIILGVYWLLVVRPETARSRRWSPVSVGPPRPRKQRLC